MNDQSPTPEEESAPADHPDALPPRQERALQALLTHPTLKEAASAAGISYETLYRYQRDPKFARRLREARRESVNHTLNRLHQASTDVVAILHDLAKREDVPAGARITAIRTILDYAVRVTEMEELRARVDSLEENARESRAQMNGGAQPSRKDSGATPGARVGPEEFEGTPLRGPYVV